MGEGRIAREGGRNSGVVERVKGEVPPDMVRGWVRPDYIFESASLDLKIVGGVTPATETVNGIIIEHGGMEKVLCI